MEALVLVEEPRHCFCSGSGNLQSVVKIHSELLSIKMVTVKDLLPLMYLKIISLNFKYSFPISLGPFWSSFESSVFVSLRGIIKNMSDPMNATVECHPIERQAYKNIAVCLHLPCWSDLMLCDFCLFPKSEMTMKGKCFLINSGCQSSLDSTTKDTKWLTSELLPKVARINFKIEGIYTEGNQW